MKRGVKLLAMDTTSRCLSVALLRADGVGPAQVMAQTQVELGVRHSDFLQEMCAELLQKCGWALNELTHLAVSAGPGSFTGLRVGLAFSRTLAQGLKLPLVPVPTFNVLARGANDRLLSLHSESELCLLLESVSQQYFTVFVPCGQGLEKLAVECLTLEEILARLKQKKKSLCIGEGALRAEPQLRVGLGAKFLHLSREVHFPQAAVCARLAYEKVLQHPRKNYPWSKALPFYIRPPLVVERKGITNK